MYTLEDLMVEIQKAMEIIQNQKNPIKITPELLADINKLEKAVNQFKEDTQDLFDLFDVDIQNMQSEILESADVRTDDKQLIKRAKDIEIEARVMKLALTKARGNKKNQSTDSSEKQQMKERRKLFKSIGGDKKWIPL